jgi:tRNA nucleotidyltransferase (CCA-adding enzyme)
MLDRLNALGLLTAIHPVLLWDPWLSRQLEHIPKKAPDPIWEIGLAYRGIPLPQALAYLFWNLRLTIAEARQVIRRLKLRNDLEEVILAASALWQDRGTLLDTLPSRVVARLDGVPLLALYAVFLATDNAVLQETINKYVGKWRTVTPTISGHDLQAHGLPPGPAYRYILTALRVAWLDGRVASEVEERQLLKKLLVDYLPEETG